MAVVKANGYGAWSGAGARALARPTPLAVACLDEALELREAGVDAPIVLLEGFTVPGDLRLVAAHGPGMRHPPRDAIGDARGGPPAWPCASGSRRTRVCTGSASAPERVSRRRCGACATAPAVDRGSGSSHTSPMPTIAATPAHRPRWRGWSRPPRGSAASRASPTRPGSWPGRRLMRTGCGPAWMCTGSAPSSTMSRPTRGCDRG